MENTTPIEKQLSKESNLKRFFNSNGLKLFLFVLILALSLSEFTPFQASKQQTTPNKIDMPTPTTSLIKTQLTKLNIIDQLPFQSELFNIEYFTDDDTFWIKIKKNPYAQHQQLALQWFKDRQTNPDDIKIEWTSVRGVAP